MLTAILTIASFVFAILIGALTKAAYYSIQVIDLKWNLWTNAEEGGTNRRPDFWLTVFLSFPISGIAAISAINGLEFKYSFAPLIWPLLCILPFPFAGAEIIRRHLRNWKLNLLEGFGVAFAATSALLAAQAVLRFA